VNPGTSSAAYIFGTNKSAGCNDIKLIESPTANFSKILAPMKPDQFGQTPLVRALRNGVAYSIKNNVQSVIAITDGADSCNEDPCQELTSSNARLKAANRKIKLLLIGYDISKDQDKFQCFKNLKLSQIDLDFASTNDAFELQRKLRDLVAEVQSNALKKIQADKQRNGNQKKASANQKQNSNGNQSPSPSNQSDSTLEILGAPAEVEFQVKSGTKKWFGSFPVILDSGSYSVQSSDARTRAVSIQIEKGQRRTLHWAEFFELPKSNLHFNSMILSYQWKPNPVTKAIHAAPESFYTYGQLSNKPTTQSVLFGEWSVELVSPPWLKGHLADQKVILEPGGQLNFDSKTQTDLIWQDSPNPAKNWVLEISYNGKIERHFIQAGATAVPVLKGMTTKWLSGAP